MKKQPSISKAHEFSAFQSASTRRVCHSAIGLLLGLSLAACGAVDDGGVFDESAHGDEVVATESAELINNGGLGAEGGACTVTDGVYKGKKGKYDEDGWCCFSNVCVECAGNRCKNGLMATFNQAIVTGNAATMTRSPSGARLDPAVTAR